MQSSSSLKALFKFVFSFCKESPFSFFFLLLISLTWSFDSTLWPYTLRLTVDALTAHESSREMIFSVLKGPIALGLSLWLLIEFGYRSQGFLLARFLPKFEAKIRLKLFDHIQRHSPSYFSRHLAGSLTNKITDMTTHATQALWQFLYSLLPAFGTFVVSLYFYSQINLFFTFTLISLVLVYTLICLFFSKKCMEKEQIHAEARSSLIGKILDSLSNHFAVNLLHRFKGEKLYIEKFQKIEMEKQIEAKKYIELMRMALSLTFLTGGVIINGFMLFLWKWGKISTGEIVQIFNMTWNIILILWYAGAEIPSLFQSLGIMKQSLSLLDETSDIDENPSDSELVVTNGSIEFKNVSFSFGEKQIFKNKNLFIKGGEKVGLVGHSGAGKSTLASLILRLLEAEEGSILIDGQDISKVSLSSLREHIAFIPQDPILFHRTIKENISYGNEKATPLELEKALILSCSDRFIEEQELGIETLVGERGSKLSGGERQRVALARALLSKAPIVILDEATSALDSMTEAHLQSNLNILTEGKTTLIIAHRLSTLTHMDKILVFHEGRIIEEGSFDELLQKQEHFYQMWQFQMGLKTSAVK